MLLTTIFTSCIIISTSSFSTTNRNVILSHSLLTIKEDRTREGRIQHQTKSRIYSAPPRRRREVGEGYYNYDDDDNENNMKLSQSSDNQKKSQESSFWYNVPNKPPPTQEEVVPHQSKLDTTGDLPYGSYKLLGKEEYESKRTCVLSTAFDFWKGYDNKQNVIDTSNVLQNVHQLIDSGFTSFQLYNPSIDAFKKSNKMEAGGKQIFTEQSIYNKIIQETPVSIINQCTFSTRINIPSSTKESTYANNYQYNDEAPFVFQENIVRQHVGQSILNMYGHANGCLDSIQVNFQSDDNNKISPYTCDVLSVLQDMQREGLIRSISGLNFPSDALGEIEQNGFSLDYNQLTCNLLDPTKYTKEIRHWKSGNTNNRDKKVVLSGALAGGLLTNRFSSIPDSCLNRYGEPFNGYMSPSESWHYMNSFVNGWVPNRNRKETRGGNRTSNKWQMFQKEIMKTLEEIAFKHQVSIASVILRWSVQLDQVGSIVIGSSLNTKFDGDDRPYNRPRDLRQIFSFMLDEEDMDRLWEIAGGDKVEEGWNGMDNDDMMGQIDFGNTKLWL